MVKFWHWTKKRTRAAQLVAEDRLTDDEIAAELGISRRSLACWKKHPDFAARVAEIVESMRQAILAEGIANKQNRIDALNERATLMRQVIAERAADMVGIPGGGTGLMVRTYKAIGTGEFARQVEEYAVDTPLLREMREHEKQAAIETGQWEEKSQVSGSVLIREYGVSLDQV